MAQRAFIIATISIFLFQPLILDAQSPRVTFFVDPVKDFSGQAGVSAILNYAGIRSDIYVDENYYNALAPEEKTRFNSALFSLSQEFDSTIYPLTREKFSSEWNPGIDETGNITILVHPMKGGVGGYFRIQDENPLSIFPDSNEREMIYLNAYNILHPLAKSYLAHEFQHLINFYQKDKVRGVREDTWLNEALSEYVPTALGYNRDWTGSYLQRRVQDFLNLPPDSLLSWQNSSSDFASVNLFIHYVVDHYGETALRKTLESEKIGVSALDEVFTPFGKTFRDVFIDWAVANFINTTTPEAGVRYSYKNSLLLYGNFHVSPRVTFSMVYGQKSQGTFSVQDWQGDVYKFQPATLGRITGDVIKIVFRGSALNTQWVVPYVISDFSGNHSVRFFAVRNGEGTIFVSNFGNSVSSVAVIPTSQFQIQEPFDMNFKTFSLEAELTNHNPGIFAEGSLLRSRGDAKVFVITNGYRRWIQSPEIFNGYGHLRWGDIQEVEGITLGDFEESFLVRLLGDHRVYEVDSAGVSRWLNMSAQAFEASGRKWEKIFTINDTELRWYRDGAEIRN